MKSTTDKQRNWMAAITFAEAGEWDTALEMMPVLRPAPKISWLQKMFMAVTFAEAGLHDDALQLMEARQVLVTGNDFLDVVGLRGVRVTYGILSAESA